MLTARQRVLIAAALVVPVVTALVIQHVRNRPLSPHEVAAHTAAALETGDWRRIFKLTSETDNVSTNMTEERFIRLMTSFVPGPTKKITLGSLSEFPAGEGERIQFAFPVKGVPGSYITVRKAPEGFRLVSGEILNSAARIYDQGPDRYKRMLAGMKQEGIEQLESFMGVITLATLERKIQDPSANILKVRTNPFANRP